MWAHITRPSPSWLTGMCLCAGGFGAGPQIQQHQNKLKRKIKGTKGVWAIGASHSSGSSPLPPGSCAAVQVAPDQAPHLDALIGGLLVLLNMNRGKAYVGVYLNSGGCINALKKMRQTDYEEFKRQFAAAETRDGRRLCDVMKGRTYQENLDMAWDEYAKKRLSELGFAKKFERAYIELDEFEMFLGSMSVYHFGAMYPCFVPLEKINADAWHLRMHLYIGQVQVRVSEAVEDSAQFKRQNSGNIMTDEPVAKYTIDLLQLPRQMRAIRTARLFLQ